MFSFAKLITATIFVLISLSNTYSSMAEERQPMLPYWDVDDNDLERYVYFLTTLAKHSSDLSDLKNGTQPNFFFFSGENLIDDGTLTPRAISFLDKISPEVRRSVTVGHLSCQLFNFTNPKGDFIVVAINNTEKTISDNDMQCAIIAVAMFMQIEPKRVISENAFFSVKKLIELLAQTQN